MGGRFGGGSGGVGRAWAVGEGGAVRAGVVPGTFADDVGFHADGASGAVEFVV